MMTSEHTKEPWYADEQSYDSSNFYIRGSDKNGKRLTFGKGAIAHLPRSTIMPTEANARRIVACVNACQGISTEELEAYKRVDFLSDGLKALTYKQQRDELLAATEQALEALWDCTVKLESQQFRNPVQIPPIYTDIIRAGYSAHTNLSDAIAKVRP